MTDSLRQIALLNLLNAHPLLSTRQIEVYWNRSRRAVEIHLRRLMQQGLLTQYNARRADTYARALYALSPAGARKLGTAPTAPLRLARLILLSERVFKTRTALIWLARRAEGWEWRLEDWDVEVALTFDLSRRKQAMRLDAHGAARFTRGDGVWLTLIVEFDTRVTPALAPTERARFIAWVEAQGDPRFIGPDRAEDLPVLAIIAQDEFRLQDYYSILRGAALARGLPMPPVYFTTQNRLWDIRAHPAAPIWYSTRSNHDRVPLLSDVVGNAAPLPPAVPWRQLPLARGGSVSADDDATTPLAPLAENARPEFTTARGLAALALALTPQDKQILDEIARHPLVTSSELAQLAQITPWYADARLTRLVRLQLIEPRRAVMADDSSGLPGDQAPQRENTPRENALSAKADPARYLLSEDGLHYLAATAGFGDAAQAYARARGWGQGLNTLAQHWEHTRAENAFMLQLARIAQERGHTLTWLSELESRLYYDYGRAKGRGQLPRSFLPDGRGTYIADTRYEFAVEIERTRAAAAKLQRKLAGYYAVVNSRILRDDASALLRVLIATSSWERAETLRRVAADLTRELKAEREPLPLWITTFDLLRVKRADAPIWLRVDAAVLASPQVRVVDIPKLYCFECFVPPPPAPRPDPPGPPRYIVQ